MGNLEIKYPDVRETFQKIRSLNGENQALITKKLSNDEIMILEKLKERIEKLPARERIIANLYLGFYDGKRLSLEEKCDFVGVSQEIFYNILKNSLDQIKIYFLEVENLGEIIDKIRFYNGEIVELERKDNIASQKDIEKVLDDSNRTDILEKLETILGDQKLKLILGNMSMMYAIVIILIFGSNFYILGRNFSMNEIAEILGISVKEVNDIYQDILLSYKDQLNMFIDTFQRDNYPLR